MNKPPHLILVVDDDPGMRETTRELLQLEGFTVDTAVDGEDALSKLQEALPCLILLDLMMPRMNGWEFLDHMHSGQLPQVPSVPVVVVSALDEAREVGARYGCSVLRKPFDIDRLFETARSHCGC